MARYLNRTLMKLRDRAEEGYVYTPDKGWPRAIPLGAAAIVAVNLLAAIHQRQMISGPGPYGPVGVPWHNGYAMGPTVAAACLAFVPYLLDAIGVLAHRP